MSRTSDRPRLGRGLASLIGSSPKVSDPSGEYQPVGQAEGLPGRDGGAAAAAAEMVNVPIEAIEANPYQPRKRFDAGSLERLAESMRAHGLVQPVVVCRGGLTRGDDPRRGCERELLSDSR